MKLVVWRRVIKLGHRVDVELATALRGRASSDNHAEKATLQKEVSRGKAFIKGSRNEQPRAPEKEEMESVIS